MIGLTDRQITILRVIVEEYIETAEPVGSESLERKYNLGVSPATVRNEMAVLTQQGLLKQPHTSAGRVPTPLAMKYYINELMQERRISVADEVATKERIWDYRHNVDRMLQEATKALAHQAGVISLACTTQGNSYSAGYANILNMPEFFDIDVTRTVLTLLDEAIIVQRWLQQAAQPDPMHVFFGDDLDQPFLEPVGFVFADFHVGQNLQGSIGVIGPARLNFPLVIPRVRYYAEIIQDMAREW